MFTPAQNEVIALLAAGRTVTAAAAECDLHRTTIHTWQRTNPDFNDAVRDAQADAAALKRDLYIAYIAEALAMLLAIMRDPKSSAGVRLKAALHILKEAYAPAPKPQTKEERRHDRLLRLGLDPQTEPDTHAEAVVQQRAKEEALMDQLREIYPPQHDSSEIITSAEEPQQPETPSDSSDFITHSAATDQQYLALLRLPTEAGGIEVFQQRAQDDALTPAQVSALMARYAAEIDTREAVFHQNSSPNIVTFVRPGPKVGRNDKCPCGSGQKFKRCCLGKKSAAA